MKLLFCSFLALFLIGCASIMANQPGEVESQDSAEWQVMELLNLLADQEAMIEALQGELIAYQEGGGDYGYVYEVRPGESLWSIAEDVLGDPYRWVTIYSMSCLLMDDPDLIYPGEILVLP